MRIALTGNPNSGKTTMYNALTGRNEKVGNWAGVTVEKKEHPIKKAYYSGTEELIAVDLPGAYSMSPFTSEESITSSYVRHEHPDAIINIVDATNLSRSLFFTTQLLELGIPVVTPLYIKNPGRPQKELTREQRLQNARGAFGCRPGTDLTGRRVLLIDDIITTGATASACALALLEAGAVEVTAVAIAAAEELPKSRKKPPETKP